MTPETAVWHGVSRKMRFDKFATYFECPTSTSTEKAIAASFSGSNGVILKLQSKYKTKCSVMLDVSTFSNYPAESERLFVKETLIITDIVMLIDDEWIQFGKWFQALVYFEVNHMLKLNIMSIFRCWSVWCSQKITTGNATDDSWNISESKKVQKTLALIIEDYIEAQSTTNEERTSKVPAYIRTLFHHYCTRKDEPRFDGLNEIQTSMSIKLQEHLFENTIDPEKLKRRDTKKANSPMARRDTKRANSPTAQKKKAKQQISHQKVQLLFPNATMYINDKGEQTNIATQSREFVFINNE